MLEHGLLRHPEGDVGERILILAVVGVHPGRPQNNQAGYILLAHALEDVGDGLRKHIGLFPGARA